MGDSLKTVLAFAVSTVAGLACVILPAFFLQDDADPFPLWPLSGPLEHIRLLPSFIGLFATGLICSYIQPRYWHLLGLSTVVLLPVNTLFGVLADSGSHNLWPIEMIVYGFYAIPGFLGASVRGVFVRERLRPDDASLPEEQA